MIIHFDQLSQYEKSKFEAQKQQKSSQLCFLHLPINNYPTTVWSVTKHHLIKIFIFSFHNSTIFNTSPLLIIDLHFNINLFHFKTLNFLRRRIKKLKKRQESASNIARRYTSDYLRFVCLK